MYFTIKGKIVPFLSSGIQVIFCMLCLKSDVLQSRKQIVATLLSCDLLELHTRKRRSLYGQQFSDWDQWITSVYSDLIRASAGSDFS